MMGRVQGKVAIVTGARRGIGKATAELLAREGARVIITDRKEEGAQEVVDGIKKVGGDAVFVLQDVAKEEDWQRVMGETSKRYGRLDILVNNAGVQRGWGHHLADPDQERELLSSWRSHDSVLFAAGHGVQTGRAPSVFAPTVTESLLIRTSHPSGSRH
jgi:NAD(P)-dependent dehydrogenase (short-subunit alcohol dehydrogenase family)